MYPDHADGEAIVVDGEPQVIMYSPAKLLGAAIGSADSNPVGSLPGRLTASDTGAAVYSMPIPVPAGRRGLQPNLSLNYSSNSGPGWLGAGFSLSGFSSVQRCNLNVRDDNGAAPVTMRATDGLCLDGAKLTQVVSPPARPSFVASESIEYRTLSDNRARIFRSNDANGQAVRFEIVSAGGHISTYAIPAGMPTPSMDWPIVEIRDRFGNAMNYTYSLFGTREVLPREIRYTNRFGQAAEARRIVEFEWEPRSPSDRIDGFRAGETIQRTQRMKAIRIKAPMPLVTTEVRSLHFSYHTSPTGRDRLTSVRLCVPQNGAQVCMEPTTFGWENGETGFERVETGLEYNRTNWDAAASASIRVMDLNGDGRDDISLQELAAPTDREGSPLLFGDGDQLGEFRWPRTRDGDAVRNESYLTSYVSSGRAPYYDSAQFAGSAAFTAQGPPSRVDVNRDGVAGFFQRKKRMFDHSYDIIDTAEPFQLFDGPNAAKFGTPGGRLVRGIQFPAESGDSDPAKFYGNYAYSWVADVTGDGFPELITYDSTARSNGGGGRRS